MAVQGQCDIRVEVGIGQLWQNVAPGASPPVDLLRLFPTEYDATGAELPATLMVDEPAVTFLAHAQRILIRAESLARRVGVFQGVVSESQVDVLVRTR